MKLHRGLYIEWLYGLSRVDREVFTQATECCAGDFTLSVPDHGWPGRWATQVINSTKTTLL